MCIEKKKEKFPLVEIEISVSRESLFYVNLTGIELV